MPRCLNCKDKFIAKTFLQKFCMQKDECVDAFTVWAKEKREKENKKIWNKNKAIIRVNSHSKENKHQLQVNINKLSRMIDEKFGFEICIDCEKTFGKQTDACHYHGVGSNESLRYNLDNLHSGRSDCNQYSATHKQGYVLGLVKRHGNDYCNYVTNELPLKFKEIRLTNQDIVDKLAIVRKIIRDFDTFVFNDAIHARSILNEIIGIYKC